MCAQETIYRRDRHKAPRSKREDAITEMTAAPTLGSQRNRNRLRHMCDGINVQGGELPAEMPKAAAEAHDQLRHVTPQRKHRSLCARRWNCLVCERSRHAATRKTQCKETSVPEVGLPQRPSNDTSVVACPTPDGMLALPQTMPDRNRQITRPIYFLLHIQTTAGNVALTRGISTMEGLQRGSDETLLFPTAPAISTCNAHSYTSSETT